MTRGHGSTTQRGYGWHHQRLRRAVAAQVAAGGVGCCRCGKLIEPGSDWHLDHDDEDRTRYKGVSHAECNVSAANRGRAGRKGDGVNLDASNGRVPHGHGYVAAWVLALPKQPAPRNF